MAALTGLKTRPGLGPASLSLSKLFAAIVRSYKQVDCENAGGNRTCKRTLTYVLLSRKEQERMSETQSGSSRGRSPPPAIPEVEDEQEESRE
jgi:hypothetical protein